MRNTDKVRRKPVASTVDPELWAVFHEFAKGTRIPASRLMDEAMEDLLLKYKIIEEKTKTP